VIFQGFHEFKPSPEIEFFFGFEVDREYPERLRWLLGYSWIDQQYRVEKNSIRRFWLSSLSSFLEEVRFSSLKR
jgi:hypothetical protein